MLKSSLFERHSMNSIPGINKIAETWAGGLSQQALVGIIACLVYSLCSMSMTLVNKAIFSSFQFQFPIFLLFFQHVFTVCLARIAKFRGIIDFTELKWDIVKIWYPVNLLFIGMLVSGSLALKLLSVPMVTIFKNITTTLITFGDFALFGQQLSKGILQSIFLMIFGSLVAGFNDLSFNYEGYKWMTINCIVSASYVLYMRFAMKKTQLNEWGMLYYNNVLAIPTLIPLLFKTGEYPKVFDTFESYTVGFYFTLFLSGVIGFAISLSSFWAVNATSPTTYSIVGALNKIPLTILGFIIFNTPVDLPGGISIGIALSGGLLYSYTKAKEKQAAAAEAAKENEDEEGSSKV